MVVAFDGQADLHTETRVRGALDEARAVSPWLVLDCSALTFCDSTFLGILVNAYKQAQADNGTVAVAAARPQLARVLNRTGLDQILTVYASVVDVEV